MISFYDEPKKKSVLKEIIDAVRDAKMEDRRLVKVSLTSAEEWRNIHNEAADDYLYPYFQPAHCQIFGVTVTRGY
jgi:hypothetical protein